MDDETVLLPELMLQSELFCASIESRVQDLPAGSEVDELRLKISQCRGALSQLQGLYDDGHLSISHRLTAANFRQLVMSLMWVSFYARSMIDFRAFRKLVLIESTLTYLLINQIPREGKSQDQQ